MAGGTSLMVIKPENWVPLGFMAVPASTIIEIPTSGALSMSESLPGSTGSALAQSMTGRRTGRRMTLVVPEYRGCPNVASMGSGMYG